MKPLFFNEIEDAECWLEDYKIWTPKTSLKIFELAGKRNCCDKIEYGGFVVATKQDLEYVGKTETGYADCKMGMKMLRRGI